MATGSRTVRPRSSVWLSERKTPKRKGDQQPVGLDHLKIVAATMRLLDAEGLSGFSMRRLAAELGVTAMSVYWYVETKDHLLELALDAAMGEMALPIEAVGPAEGLEHTPAEPRDWREQLRQVASEYRRVLVRHPWLSALLGEYLNIGPNAVVFQNAALAVMRNSGLPDDRITSGLALVYQFVYGFGTIEGRFAARCRASGVTQEELFHEMMGTVEDRMEFDEARKIMEARGGVTVQEMQDRDFTFALDLAIAGIEALRER
ncbi:TetR/AcrR family transcriptional regulator C-terminal domain-containing protein [Streptomyces sp. DSM 41524]|uniref:TetR/AcrR family transcriptional regulator C-terminal domain-containing protein n=1 Tax=Streptomyces asiaticus subsp. ignotus TaxID=3098222 RepID=A0ABU7Q4R4_9ACTN|nr:TetR/AcrR family transcriptional regulator C-terminal domain-containing protein [Streptomyces sp. DASNCL29]MEE4596352.1 TetR/AcrR family transcriptional regulator C-terminal domain-containing protein [Streptomyces sp. DSM 41524]TMU93716.1 TetR family transcriptional regulator [Streptomyces sp. DASNCL29]